MSGAGASFMRGRMGLRVDDGGGRGLPIIFQHGLCGDASQTKEVFPDDPRFRRITLECRGHGGSDCGDAAAFSIATFAEDITALIEERGWAPLVVGGISMGAAISLRLAVRRADCVRALILARPAWVTGQAPDNMAPNAEVGHLLAKLPAGEAQKTFLASKTAKRLADEGPDNLTSLQGFFSRKPQAVTAALLETISGDGPGISDQAARGIRVPTLVIGHGQDVVHPFAHAERLAALIPGARLVAITSKVADRARYVADFRAALAAFLVEFL